MALIQNEEGLFDSHYEMSNPHAGKVDAIVWPDYAVPFDPNTHPQAKSLPHLLRGNTKVLVLGGQNETTGDFYNTAFTQGQEAPLGEHAKNHTVHLFADGIPGTTAETIDTPFGKIGTPICFDCDYQDVMRKMTAKGAEFPLIPVRDAQSWTEQQHLQHAQLFRHRTAESGRCHLRKTPNHRLQRKSFTRTAAHKARRPHWNSLPPLPPPLFPTRRLAFRPPLPCRPPPSSRPRAFYFASTTQERFCLCSRWRIPPQSLNLPSACS